jgi:hypothetical protein
MWLEDWQQSGKKAWTYAKENGLIPQTFCTWAKKETGKERTQISPRFVEVKAAAMPAPAQTTEVLIKKGDVRINITFPNSSEEIRTVMNGLWSVI